MANKLINFFKSLLTDLPRLTLNLSYMLLLYYKGHAIKVKCIFFNSFTSTNELVVFHEVVVRLVHHHSAINKDIKWLHFNGKIRVGNLQ